MEKNIAFCSMEKFDNRLLNSVGSSRIRVRWLLPYWEEAEEYVIGKKYDVLIFQKVYWREMMKVFKGIKILDLCDPDWLENKPVFEFIDLCDAITTSTKPLAEFIKKMRPDALVKYIPDRIYLPEAHPIKEQHSDELRKLVWFGYSQNSHYLTNTFEQLILKNMELTVISDQAIDIPMIYRTKIIINNVPYNYATLNKELIKYDAVIMPDPTGDEKSKYKSNNKTLQAWSLGMPVVKIPEDIDRLMTKEAREIEAKEKLEEIKNKFDVKYSVQEYKDLIEEIKRRKNV
jgi:hypothetical protein